MYNYLVLGASGFIGKHFIKFLKSKKANFFAVDRNFGNLKFSETWRRIPKARTVVNLASKIFVPASWILTNEFLTNNIKITLNMLDYAKKNNSNVVQMSSYLYGNTKQIPVDENSKVEVSNPYSLSKYLSEKICKFYNENNNISCNILRTFNLYGEFQNKNFLIPSILNQIKKKEIYLNDLKPKRDLLYIDDFIKLIYKASNKFSEFNIFNVGYGKSYSINEIIKIIEKITQKKIKIKLSKNFRKNEIYNTVANINKAKLFFNWTPKTNLETGLKKIIKNDISYRSK